MTNALSLSPSKPIGELPQWLASSVSAMSTDYPPKIPAGMALTTEKRSHVTALVSDCERMLAPATKREIGAIVMQLLADYPADGASEALEDARSRNWIEALEGLPAWGIEAARRKWLRREVEGANPDFAPKPARFREIVMSCLVPIYERRSRLTMLLKAKPEEEGELSDEKRAALVEMLRRAARDIGSSSSTRKVKERSPAVIARAHRINLIRQTKRNRADPPPLSEAMRRKLQSEGVIPSSTHPATDRAA